MKKLLQSAINKIWHATHPQYTPTVSVDDLNPVAYAGQTSPSPWENSLYDGSKFFGGFGDTQIFDVDYWTLRKRSAQLFKENLYARGLIRRLITKSADTAMTARSIFSPKFSKKSAPGTSLSAPKCTTAISSITTL